MRADVAKIDVEGFELEVLRGGSDTFGRCRVIGVEVHPRASVTEQQVLEVLESVLGDNVELVRFERSGSRPSHLLVIVPKARTDPASD